MAYSDIRGILLDAWAEIPVYKSFFVGTYIQGIRRNLINFNRENKAVNLFAEKEGDYFEILDEFINKNLMLYYERKALPTGLFNKIICLSVIIPDLVDFLKKRHSEINEFKISQKFLQHASLKNVPQDFFAHLALMLITDEIRYRVKKIMDLKVKEKIEWDLDTIKVLTTNSFMILDKYARMSQERVTLQEPCKPTDIIIKDGRSYGIQLWEGNNATVTSLFADRGCGKTVALFRCIYASLNGKYTVIAFGTDVRKEFRFAHFPMETTIDPNLYQMLRRQGEKPQGLPVSIYMKDPKYSIEHDVNEFNGTPEEWESLYGFVLFEDNIIEMMKSFMEWRAENRKKKVVLAFNEIHRMLASVGDRKAWRLSYQTDKLYTEHRGLGCPLLQNTQYISRVQKSAHQFDVMFASLITNPKERKKLSDIYGMGNISTLLAIQSLKQEHAFFKIQGNRRWKVRFLAPPCMLENTKYSLEDLFNKKR